MHLPPLAMFRLEALRAFHQEAPQQVVQVELDMELKSLREFRCEPLLDRRPMDIQFLRELAQLRARSMVKVPNEPPLRIGVPSGVPGRMARGGR